MSALSMKNIEMTKETRERWDQVKNKRWSIQEKMKYALQIPMEDIQNILPIKKNKNKKRKLN